MIFSNSSLSEYPATDQNNNKNAYNITLQANHEAPYWIQYGTEETFGIVIPSALANIFASKPGDVVKLMQGFNNEYTTRFQVRATASTMPGMFFTNY